MPFRPCTTIANEISQLLDAMHRACSHPPDLTIPSISFLSRTRLLYRDHMTLAAGNEIVRSLVCWPHALKSDLPLSQKLQVRIL